MNFTNYGITGLIVLALDIYAILNISGSSISIGKKVAWIVFVLFFPVLGFIVWWLAGPRSNSTS